MGPLSRLPLGLLEVFDVRTLGNYPRSLGDQIAPTYDISLLQHQNVIRLRAQQAKDGPVLANAWTGLQAFNDFDVDGVATPAEVPAGQSWLITRSALLVEGDATATEVIGCNGVRLCWQPIPNSGLFFTEPVSAAPGQQIGNADAGTQSVWMHSTDEPFIIPGSAVIGLWFEGSGLVCDANTQLRSTWFAELIRLRS